MKIIDLPTRLFETGDRVLTPDGPGTVVHDELEGIDTDYDLVDYALNRADRLRCAEHAFERDAVIVRLDDPGNGGRDEVELDRVYLVYPLEEKR